MEKDEKQVITCHSGWKSLYEPILNKILIFDREKKAFKDKIGILSIRNDHGMLTFDLCNDINLPKDLRSEITNASCRSLNSCEYCGTSEKIGYTCCNTARTCCEKCYEENIKKTFPREIWYERKMFKKES